RNSRNKRIRRLAMNPQNLPPPAALGNRGVILPTVGNQGINPPANSVAAATDIERLLRDYANPSLLGNESSIRRPPNEGRATMEVAAGGTLMGKTPNEAQVLIEEIATNSYQWGATERNQPRSGVAGVYEVKVITTLTA
ncbi:hypothetical protein Dimus_031723, partial [Dionaea muscipula]